MPVPAVIFAMNKAQQVSVHELLHMIHIATVIQYSMAHVAVALCEYSV